MLSLIDDEMSGTVTIFPCLLWSKAFIDDDFVHGELSTESRWPRFVVSSHFRGVQRLREIYLLGADSIVAGELCCFDRECMVETGISMTSEWVWRNLQPVP